jgi:ankyrin repeat protein
MLASTRENLEIIKLLVENKADIYQTNKDGWNCMQIAVREGHKKIVTYYLSLDIKLAYDIRTRNGRTPSHTACLHGHLDVLKILLENSDRLSGDSSKSFEMLNAKDNCGMTPFHEAILADHVDIAKYLVQSYSVRGFFF